MIPLSVTHEQDFEDVLFLLTWTEELENWSHISHLAAEYMSRHRSVTILNLLPGEVYKSRPLITMDCAGWKSWTLPFFWILLWWMPPTYCFLLLTPSTSSSKSAPVLFKEDNKEPMVLTQYLVLYAQIQVKFLWDALQCAWVLLIDEKGNFYRLSDITAGQRQRWLNCKIQTYPPRWWPLTRCSKHSSN